MNNKALENIKEPIGKYISIIYRGMNSILDKQLEKYDIGRGQFPFLIPLYQQEGISQKELCQFYNVDKAAATRGLKKLEKNAYIQRRKSPEDKRQDQIFLTKKAREFKPQLFKIIEDSENKVLQDLNKEEKEQLRNILIKISAGLVKSQE